MSLYDNEENAIVNNANDTSETPSNLVNESPDQEYNKNGAKLSPNPAGFGFIKQLFVTPENTATNGEPNLPGEPNVLYLVQVINDGVLVGFRKYKWTPSDGFVQFGASPDLKLKDSPRETPTRVENEPKKNLAQIFNGDIAVNGDLFVKGQKVGDNGIVNIDLTDLTLDFDGHASYEFQWEDGQNLEIPEFVREIIRRVASHIPTQIVANESELVPFIGKIKFKEIPSLWKFTWRSPTSGALVSITLTAKWNQYVDDGEVYETDVILNISDTTDINYAKFLIEFDYGYDVEFKNFNVWTIHVKLYDTTGQPEE